MDYETFIRTVEHSAEIGWDDAERATRATLETLAERISQGEAKDLAEQLPPEVAPYLATTTDAERFDLDEFLARIARRAEVDRPTAYRYARAVFDAVSRAVKGDEFDDLVAELPKQYAALLPRGPAIEVPSYELFLRNVMDRTGLDEEGARRATEAVLQTLAERIAGGEVDDLIGRLPPELHEPLRRGREKSGEKAQPMSLDDFLERVAEYDGVSTLDARDHARAVLLTLREAVGDDEFFDVAVQLPDAYMEALAR
jgi:uncharacterized protein (DUF2267 family)